MASMDSEPRMLTTELTPDVEKFPDWAVFVIWFQSVLYGGGLWLAWLL